MRKAKFKGRRPWMNLSASHNQCEAKLDLKLRSFVSLVLFPEPQLPLWYCQSWGGKTGLTAKFTWMRMHLNAANMKCLLCAQHRGSHVKDKNKLFTKFLAIRICFLFICWNMICSLLRTWRLNVSSKENIFSLSMERKFSLWMRLGEGMEKLGV